MDKFRTVDGREVFVQEVGLRQRKGAAVLLSGEGRPTVLVIGSRELEPEKFLEIQNRSNHGYDTVTRVNLGMIELSPVKGARESLHIMGGGLPGNGTGPQPGEGSISEVIPPGCEQTAVWLVSSAKARYAAVFPFAWEPGEVMALVSEVIEGPFVIESLYGSNVAVADKDPVPSWTLYTERLVEPAPGPGLR